MSKELEALERLYEWATHRADSYGRYLMKDNKEIVLEALKRNEPMKVVSFDPSSYYGELGYFGCPKCGEILTKEYYNYCPECGQKFDRGDSNE